jgi:hypothetical protein
MTVIRSQARLAAELRVSDRHVRNGIAFWRAKQVLQEIERGGGSGRKPSKYRLDIAALKLYALEQADQIAGSLPVAAIPNAEITPEVQEFRVADSGDQLRKANGSGVNGATQEAHTVPEFDGTRDSSGVSAHLRNDFERTPEQIAPNSGSPGVPTLHSLHSLREEIISEVCAPVPETQARPSPPARPAKRRAVSAIKAVDGSEPESERDLETERLNRIAQCMRYWPSHTDEEIARLSRATVEEVSRMRASRT